MKSLLAIALMLLPITSQATTISGIFTMGIDFGGKELVKGQYIDGSTSTIHAGAGFSLTAGTIFVLPSKTVHTFEVQSTIGFKVTGLKSSTNSSANWIRFPIDLLAFYHNIEQHFRLGGGITYHIGNELTCSGKTNAQPKSYKNAIGKVFQGDYFFGNEKIGLGMRYTMMNYLEKNDTRLVNGDSFGFQMTYLF